MPIAVGGVPLTRRMNEHIVFNRLQQPPPCLGGCGPHWGVEKHRWGLCDESRTKISSGSPILHMSCLIIKLMDVPLLHFHTKGCTFPQKKALLMNRFYLIKYQSCSKPVLIMWTRYFCYYQCKVEKIEIFQSTLSETDYLARF